ncbi:LacI family transcriptional regulator [Actinoplanes sp. OR16]|uniref:substrate-binding domain-containing protein n=1 Tax=Actinoplanes sp. OR16 TaxID=946334 RepID=UPI000F6E3644|nr:substrate-binding domain-containing protein [Actinoplanes sp. OR16]BBH69468.1 LacI family transcriptional regulator [Actinoplanes sp. OR16]
MGRLIGLVLTGGAARVGVEPFFSELIAGMEEALAPRGATVLLLVVPDLEAERDTYRRWSADHTVAAVVVVNLTHDDSRPACLHALGLPAVLAGRSPCAHFPRVLTDDAAAMTAAVESLIELGHRTIGRVSGPTALVHTAERSAALAAVASRHGVRVVEVEGDYGAASGVAGVRALLAAAPPPTAVVFDNDVMAVAAQHELSRAGVTGVSLLACDDSPLCELAAPPLSALSKNVHAHGLILGEAVLSVLAATPPRDFPGPPITILHRATTTPPPPPGP